MNVRGKKVSPVQNTVLKCEEERGTRLDKKRKKKQRAKMQLLPHEVCSEISDYEREREKGVWLAKQEKPMALLIVDPPPVSE